MWIPKSSSLVLVVVMVAGCGEDDPAERVKMPLASPELLWEGGPLGKDGEIDWAAITPVQFLAALKAHPQGGVCIIVPPPKDWLKTADAHELLAWIESTEPAGWVVTAISSYIPIDETSTVGREAQFLIQGLRTGGYPPALCSLRHFQPDPDACRRWLLDGAPPLGR